MEHRAITVSVSEKGRQQFRGKATCFLRTGGDSCQRQRGAKMTEHWFRRRHLIVPSWLPDFLVKGLSSNLTPAPQSPLLQNGSGEDVSPSLAGTYRAPSGGAGVTPQTCPGLWRELTTCMLGTAGVAGLGRRWRACEAPETLYSRRHWHHLPLALAGGGGRCGPL